MPALNWIIVVSVLISGVNSFTVIRSTDLLGRGDVDKFSNTDCVPALCGSLRSATCWTTDCCFCQCNYATPNYVMSEGVCKTNDEVDTGKLNVLSIFKAEYGKFNITKPFKYQMIVALICEL